MRVRLGRMYDDGLVERSYNEGTNTSRSEKVNIPGSTTWKTEEKIGVVGLYTLDTEIPEAVEHRRVYVVQEVRNRTNNEDQLKKK